ncbi:MAG: MFS transporter [Negativicutes bacterium]|nr:MFS transporter [Negativicutes bacterium]
MKNRGLAILTVGHLYTDMNQGLLPGLLPFLISAHNLSFEAAAGLVFAANILASLVQPLLGYLADRYPMFAIMPAGTFLAGAGLAATGLVSDYWLLFCAVAVSGVGVAAFHPEAARLTNHISGDRKGAGVSTFTAGGNVGNALGPLAAVGIVSTWGLGGTLVLAVPALLVAALFVSERCRLQGAAQENKMQSMPAPTDEWGSFFRLSLAITLRSIIVFGLNTFLPLYWIHVLHQSPAAGSSILTIIFIVGAIASLIAGRLADRFGHRQVVRAAFILLLPTLLIFIQVRDVFLATVLLLPIAVALFASFSPMVVIGQKYLPNHMGLASGITLGLAVSIGGTAAPILGRIADRYGIEATFTLIAFLPLLAVAAAFMLPKPQVDMPAEEPEAAADDTAGICVKA